MAPCVSCRIFAGELPSSPVPDRDLVAAFLDIHPWNPGHTLVLPRRHVESFTDLKPMEVEQLALCGQRIATAVKESCTWSRDERATVSVGE
jgi:histidine triad (HIT) family protein